MMNPHNAPANYMATNRPQPANNNTSTSESESRIDKGYLLSVRGILKFVCLLFCFTAFICLVSTPNCNGSHVFLTVVAVLTMTMQITIIIVFALRLKAKFPGIDFELLDFFSTSHDALYLLIASSVAMHFCRIPGQIAGGAMGIIAFFALVADAVIIFLAQRAEPATNTNQSSTR